jgi:hypothetical protein
MIAVTETISGQSFESIKLSAEYFKIPIATVLKSLKSEKHVEVNGRKYIFVYRTFSMKGATSTAGPMQRFPFGKYKNKKISQCTDLSYMIWLIEKPDVNIRLKSAINRRIKELKDRLTT